MHPSSEGMLGDFSFALHVASKQRLGVRQAGNIIFLRRRVYFTSNHTKVANRIIDIESKTYRNVALICGSSGVTILA